MPCVLRISSLVMLSSFPSLLVTCTTVCYFFSPVFSENCTLSGMYQCTSGLRISHLFFSLSLGRHPVPLVCRCTTFPGEDDTGDEGDSGGGGEDGVTAPKRNKERASGGGGGEAESTHTAAVHGDVSAPDLVEDLGAWSDDEWS